MFNACIRGHASMLNATRIVSRTFAPTARSIYVSSSSIHVYLPTSTVKHLRIAPVAHFATAPAVVQAEDGTVAVEEEILVKFEDLYNRRLVHKSIVSQITKEFGHHTMTPVQALTINETVKGTDIVAQAKTGTGKTLGFLIPVVHNILEDVPELAKPPLKFSSRSARTPRGRQSGVFSPSDIRAIIISPTRELAEQIAVEAKRLTAQTSMKVQIAVGGSNKQRMLRDMQREGCHLLVATPGRLNDLLRDRYSGVSAPNLKALVLDEADRLLDSGFQDELAQIMEMLPDRSKVDRQTLLFSATVPDEVKDLVKQTLKPDFRYVNTISENETPTHEKIPQVIVKCAGMENFLPALLELCQQEIEASQTELNMPFKAIVYYSSTTNVNLAAEIFRNLVADPEDRYSKHPLHPLDIYCMHGQLSQERRSRVSNNFRKSKSAIMFSSDVTARGMDFPNVTHVIQVGLPPSREQYIHRIGRTGRGDKAGKGYIFVMPAEEQAARKMLRGLPVNLDRRLKASQVDVTDKEPPAEQLQAIFKQIGLATQNIGEDTLRDAFFGAIGTAQQLSDREAYLEGLERWAKHGWGMPEPPQIGAQLAAKLGLGRRREMSSRRPRSLDNPVWKGRDSRSPRDREQRGGFRREHDDHGRGRRDGGDRRTSRDFDRGSGRGYGDRGRRDGDRDDRRGRGGRDRAFNGDF